MKPARKSAIAATFAALLLSGTTSFAAAQGKGFVPGPITPASSAAFKINKQIGNQFVLEAAVLRANRWGVWGIDSSIVRRALAHDAVTYDSSSSWTGQNCVTGVRNQGFCGACWDFAATAALESSYCINKGQIIDAAEQSALECMPAPATIAGRCNDGGYEFMAYDVMRAGGLDQEVRRPYNPGTYAACAVPLGNQTFYGIDGSTYLTAQAATGQPSVDDIKTAIIDSGAVTLALIVTSNFDNYSSTTGVISNVEADLLPENGASGGHEVVITGWDDTRGAWRIKNSWGTHWSDDNGFAWIAYNDVSITLYGDFFSHVTPMNKWNTFHAARIFALLAARLVIMPDIWVVNPKIQFPTSLGFPRGKQTLVDGFKWAISHSLVTQAIVNRWPIAVRNRLR